MSLFKTDWKPHQSEEWTIHDLLAAIFSVLSFLLVAIGVIGALLLQVWGVICLAAAALCILLMYRIIDPKLRASSRAYEEKQEEYLESLERRLRWEPRDGD